MNTIETPRITPFNGDRVSFGRHESFPLRYAWLTKGFQAIENDPRALQADDATVQLGVGRNMVHSIRYWLRACRIAEADKDGLIPTTLGHLIFGQNGFDRYLEDEATIWLLHWLLSTNTEEATAWYWLFNRFHKPEFTGPEVTTALTQFLRTHITAKQSVTKVKQDAAIVLRMYVQTKAAPRTPIEDALDSPLATLRLISFSPGGRRYQSKPGTRLDLPISVLAFAIAELFAYHESAALPIEELISNRTSLPAPGSIFRLSEAGLLSKLEQLTTEYPDEFELRETAGLHQLYKLGQQTSLDFLRTHYARYTQLAA